MNECIFVTCRILLHNRLTALRVYFIKCVSFLFLWHVKPYRMLLIDKHESKTCWNKSSWMTIWMKGHALTGSTHSNFFLSCISCSLQTYSRDVSWKCCLIASTDTSAWKTEYKITITVKMKMLKKTRKINHHMKIKSDLRYADGKIFCFFPKRCLPVHLLPALPLNTTSLILKTEH